MSKKVVHIVLNPFIQDSRVIRECAYLAKCGYEVTVIAYWINGMSQEEVQDGFNIRRLPLMTKSWANISIIQVLKYFEFLIKALIIIRKIKPDICHGHDPNGLLVAYFVKHIYKCKLIYDSHELWSDSMHLQGKKKIIFKFGRRIEKLLIKSTDIVITVNNSIADIIRAENELTSIAIIRNIPKKSVEKSHCVREELGFPLCKFIIIYIGNIEKGRGIEKIIQAMKKVNNDIGLVLMGRDSVYKKEMESFAQTLNLESRIKFLNTVLPHQVINVCKLADVGISPIQNMCKSYYLSLPNKIFEYIQAGLPVLASDFPEMKKIIKDYSLGLTFDVEDTIQIADVINLIYSDKNSYKSFCENSKIASLSLNWEVEQLKLLSVYNKLN